MSVFYLDTSAIVKRYFPESGTAWIQGLADPGSGNTLLLGELTLAETAAVIAAKQRASGGITLVERDAILQRFLQHCNDEYVLLSHRSADLGARNALVGLGDREACRETLRVSGAAAPPGRRARVRVAHPMSSAHHGL